MRMVKVIAVMLVGPIIGLMLGFFLGSFFIPSNPAPGDGFLLIFTGGAGFIVFCVVSALFAARIWRRSSGQGF
jgi:hypothetical protein